MGTVFDVPLDDASAEEDLLLCRDLVLRLSEPIEGTVEEVRPWQEADENGCNAADNSVDTRQQRQEKEASKRNDDAESSFQKVD